MIITKIRIHNYRSIRELEVKCGSTVVILGENNSGKSNLLAAVEFFLTSSARPEPDDLFAFRESGDDSLWVELEFAELSEQEAHTFKKYVHSNKTVRVRKTASWDENGTRSIEYNGYVEEPSEDWLKADNAGSYASQAAVKGTPLAEFVPGGRLSKAAIEKAQIQYINAHKDELKFMVRLENSPLLGQRNVAAGVLPDFYLVPAIRDLDDEAAVKSTTMFGKLLSRAIEEMAEGNERFIRARESLESLVASFNRREANEQRPEQLDALEQSIEEELSEWDVQVSIRIEPPDIGKIFELGTSLYLDDGLETVAQRKGHGLQRAVVFGLIKSWAKSLRSPADSGTIAARRASDSLIFAFEEPELFLHPQAQRALALALRQLGESSHHQILLCSHSSHFVDLDHYNDIVVTVKDSVREGTIVKQCTDDLFEGGDIEDRKRRFHMAYWVNPERGEIFFARKVVFVEGETERSLFPYLAKKLGCYRADVTIVDCGSKHNLPLYITIANAFSLEYHVVHDEDPVPDPIPDTWNSDKVRSKKGTFALNHEISELLSPQGAVFVCCKDLESVSGVSRTQGQKKGKALAAIEHFQDMRADDVPEELANLIRAIYTVRVA